MRLLQRLLLAKSLLMVVQISQILKFLLPLLAIPPNNLITLFQSDGTTEIDVGDSPADYLDGNSRQNPLLIRSMPIEIFMNAGSVWKVSGTISNSLSVKGIRCRMYRNAVNRLGYYEKNQPAFYYDGSDDALHINVLFKTEYKALEFQSLVRSEPITFQSPINGLKFSVQVTSGAFQLGDRIFGDEYVPTESDSPQDTMSVVSLQYSTYEETSDEFKYQRIEKCSIFGTIGKAESCHLMYASHCKKYHRSYAKYDNDPSNRLAMSRDLQDGLTS